MYGNFKVEKMRKSHSQNEYRRTDEKRSKRGVQRANKRDQNYE